MEIYYDCFTTYLREDGCIDVKYKFFDEIYTALIYAYKQSYIPFKHNIPKNIHFFFGYEYISVVRRYCIKFYEGGGRYNEYFPEKINIKKIYHDKMRKIKLIQQFYKQRLKRRIKSIVLIQIRLRESIANPFTKLCKRRLLREFNEMT